MRAGRTAHIGVLVGVVSYLASLLPGARPHPGPARLWDVGVYVAVLAGVAVVCLLRAVREPVDRLAWAMIGTGFGSYATGTGVFAAYLGRLPSIPYPSISDGLWLLLYPLVVVGVGLMVRARLSGTQASVWLDGIVSGLGLASMSAALVFQRVTEGASGSPAAIMTNFAYPVLDLALVTCVIGAVTMLGTWRDRSWLLLGAGFLTFSGADSWYLLQIASNTYQQGCASDSLYLVGAAMVASAAQLGPVPRTDDATDTPEARSFLIPGAFALLAIGVLASGARHWVAPILAAMALTAAWTRTTLTVRDVVRLSDSRRQALTDALTGLPNRRAFYQIVDEVAPERDGAGPDQGALVLTDLDRFKEINDAVGHHVGDQLLRQVSVRFATLVPRGGTLARLGGDEFALYGPGMSLDAATALSRQLLDSLVAPFEVQGLSLHLDASIGITAVEPGGQVSQALAKADLAMYRAKAARSGCEVYSDQRDGDAWDRLAIGEDLRAALADGGLTVEFQPITALPSHQTTGVEALVRWTHPTRGRIPLDIFLPLAEKAGLMSSITYAVLNLSLDEATRLRELGHEISVSVNLSATDLLNDALVDHLADALAERGLRGEVLRLEITESLLVDSGSGALSQLVQLQRMGVDLAVDDYGTGYSCLAYLHDLPVSYLKIDRSFVDRVLEDDRTAIIVASTIEMAHSLGLKVVAEGVETSGQQEWLAEHDCDLLQGYHISRPLPAGPLHEWLIRRERAAVPAGAGSGPRVGAQPGHGG